MKSPMLAAATDGKNLKLPKLASPKLDGVRALVINGQVLSRKFKPIPNKHVQAMFGHAKFNGLDGELIVGSPEDPECFRKTMSGVMSEEGKPNVVFYVFDDFSIPLASFVFRLESAFQRATQPGMRYVTHVKLQTEEQLEAYESQALTRGYEGVMLRHPSGLYKEGRSTLNEGWLLKLKRFEDSEAEVIGYSELMHNANEKTITTGAKAERSHKKAGLVGQGALGALQVRDTKSGTEFELGSGFTAAERKVLWTKGAALIGLFVSYQFFPLGVKDKPRFPTFKGFRDPIDF